MEIQSDILYLFNGGYDTFVRNRCNTVHAVIFNAVKCRVVSRGERLERHVKIIRYKVSKAEIQSNEGAYFPFSLSFWLWVR